MSLRSSSQQPSGILYMSNAMGSRREPNLSRTISNQCALPPGHVADKLLTAESMLSKRPVLRTTAALFFLLICQVKFS